MAKYDYNMVAIGAGAAGLVTAYICAATKGKVALIEKHKMGGDCLNTGCVPSKTLIRSAKFMKDASRATDLGFKSVQVSYDWNELMGRVQRVIKAIEPHDSVERYTSLGVTCFTGEAEILSPNEVKVNGQVLRTKNITIATGARPFVPPIKGVENVTYHTSDTIWGLKEKPESMVIVGGGPIGCELSQAFSRLGVKVTQIEAAERILLKEDPEVSELVHKKMSQEGVEILLGHKLQSMSQNGKIINLECEHKGSIKKMNCEVILFASGRKPNTTGFGLEKLNIELNPNGTVKVDEFLRTTRYKNIYACGDVAGPYQFTHTAAHQAWYCAVNSMLKPFWGFKADYRVIPWATYTDPEVARVGLNEQDAKEKNIPYDVTVYQMDHMDRALADEAGYGFVKVLTVPKKDKILGVTIAGLNSGEIITEYISAMKHGFGMNQILATTHIYPTLSEANKYAAGQWKKNQVTAAALAWGERINRFRRSVL